MGVWVGVNFYVQLVRVEDRVSHVPLFRQWMGVVHEAVSCGLVYQPSTFDWPCHHGPSRLSDIRNDYPVAWAKNVFEQCKTTNKIILTQNSTLKW